MLDASIDPTERLRKLNKKASDFECDDKIPVIRYLRSTKEMERMALVYAEEKNFENGFLLYMKLIVLLVEKLPKHPQYKNVNPDEKKAINKRCNNALQAAEKLKSLLKVEFAKEHEQWLLQEKERKRREEEELRKQEEQRRQEEAIRRENEKRNLEQQKKVASTQPPVQSIPTASNFSSINQTDSKPSAPPNPTPLLPTRPQNDFINLPPPPQYSAPPPPQSLPSQAPPSYFTAIQNKTDMFYQPPSYQGITPPPSQSTPSFDRSSKPNLSTKPDINRSTKPTDVFRQDSSLDGNRKVIISPDLVPRFLDLAAKNTAKNLETCGILTGKLARNSFCITHLVIPKQTATSDSCTTECEEELFEVQDKHDLITLGWIHTHPTQTSFLSSVDLHTQCSYQQLMPEAIAIVCSPKYQTIGIYQLTDHGLVFISSCTQTGFHPHPKEPPLYEETPLVSVDNSLKVEMIDLR